jgi:hypothetical protein
VNANEKIDMEGGKDQSVVLVGNEIVEKEATEVPAREVVIEATEERGEEHKGETKVEEESGPNHLRTDVVEVPTKGEIGPEVLHLQRRRSPHLILPTLYQFWTVKDG